MPAIPYRGLLSGDAAQPDASTAPRGLAAGADTPPDNSLIGQVTQFPGNVAKLASAFYNHPSVIAPAVGQTALDMTGFPAFQAGVQHTAQGNEPAAISDAMNVAGSLGFAGMGASHATGDVGDLGMFAGNKSAARLASSGGKFEPADMLNKAETMRKAGASEQDIWKATSQMFPGTPYTGAFADATGTPMWEFSDAGLRTPDPGFGQGLGPSSAIQHSLFARIFPDSANIESDVNIAPELTRAGMLIPNDYRLKVRAPTPAIAREVAAHELGHYAQLADGLPTGGNPKWFEPGGRYYNPAASKSAMQQYYEMPGEQAARAIGDRSTLSDADLRAIPPMEYLKGGDRYQTSIERLQRSMTPEQWDQYVRAVKLQYGPEKLAAHLRGDL